MNLNLIAIHGFKQSGKDTLAALLVEEFGYQRIAFADRLKNAVHVIFGVDKSLLFGSDEDKQKLSPVRWEDFSELRKPHPDHPIFLSIRELLQIFATEMCRDKIPSIWYRYLPIDAQTPMVVSDLRFKNEAQFLSEHNACLIKVERPGINSTHHESEKGLPNGMMHHILQNDDSLENFLHQGRELFLNMGLKRS
jgi:hypothetical protein